MAKTYYLCKCMKGIVYCPHCMEKGKRTIIGKYEDVVGSGNFFLWCRWCRREIRVPIGRIRLDR